MKSKQMISYLLAGGTLLSASLLSAKTAAADYNLRMSHPWPSTSAVHQGLADWAKAVEQDSGQRITIDIYPAQTLSKAASAYQSVVHNIADIAATVQSYNANRFPLTQIVELPGLVDNAAGGSCIIQTLYDEGLINNEYSDTHALYVYTNGPGHIHMKDKPVVLPQDLAGQRIRRPSIVVGQLLDSIGAQPTGLPAPETYEALEKGVLEGVAISWDGAKIFRLNEIAPYHTELNLYRLSFVVTMNKRVYQQLPEDLQQVIDRHSGHQWSQHMAKIFDQLDQQAINEVRQRNDHLQEMDPQSKSAWQPVLQQVTQQYLDGLQQKGLPAQRVYDRARQLQPDCTI